MNCTIYVAKTKALISCAVTAQLNCAFVFFICKNPVFSWFGSIHTCMELILDHNGYFAALCKNTIDRFSRDVALMLPKYSVRHYV